MMSCGEKGENPFYGDYQTPFGTPPFAEIKMSHYRPAFDKGITENRVEIDAIVNNQDAPTFTNTIVAMENSGGLLRKVKGVFYNLNSADTNEEMQAIAKEYATKFSQLKDDIRLNKKLFARIRSIYEQRESLELKPVQLRLLEDYYKSFVRGGANLEGKEEESFRAINQQLSEFTLQFGENVLKETNRFEMVIENREDLAGLPEGAISAAIETAKERGHEGKWVFTEHKPSLIPFLQYSEKRELREKMFKGYINRGDNNDDLDNKTLVTKIAALRVHRSKLLGFNSHAAYVLDENMAKTPENVYGLINKIWPPALAKAKEDAGTLEMMMNKEGIEGKLEPWDWWYYSEKLKKEKYALDDEQLRPYFKLENVRNGAFAVAKNLYGITFTERKDIPVYHPDVTAFEVKDSDGSHIGVFFVDYFPRASKRGGAWMNDYRMQSGKGKDAITPIICNVCNFTKPTPDKPSLLTIDEVETLFHEFGHGLHGLLSKSEYRGLAGTSVSRDFVEMPSQIMENWALHPEVLKMYAKHYETGEPIPDELVQKLEKASYFNQGFITTEYLSAAFLDLDWHTITDPAERDVHEFENNSMDRIGLIPEIVVRYRSPYFRHIFAGGYSAGYYSYIWAEVLDADAFQAFKENGIFDQKTARSFRENILEKGNTEDPMVLYRKFRGAEPGIEPLLERKGLN